MQGAHEWWLSELEQQLVGAGRLDHFWGPRLASRSTAMTSNAESRRQALRSRRVVVLRWRRESRGWWQRYAEGLLRCLTHKSKLDAEGTHALVPGAVLPKWGKCEWNRLGGAVTKTRKVCRHLLLLMLMLMLILILCSGSGR